MKKTLLSICCFITATLIGFETNPIETEKIRLIAERYEKGQSEAWPTLRWKDAPLVVTFENGNTYALGLKNSPSLGKMQLGGFHLLFGENDPLRVEGIPMQPWFEIEGKEGFLYRMGEGKNPIKEASILAHERFHRHQLEFFAPPQKGGKSADHLNEENLVLSEMEDELILRFLGSEKEERLELLKDFAAILELRRAGLKEETKEWENHQLKMEGLADYVASKLFGGRAFLLNMKPSEGDGEFIDHVIKWRHYLAGALLGYALDEIGVLGWQQRIEKGEDLVPLFLRGISLSKEEKEKRIHSVKQRLNYEEKKKKMAFRLKQYHEDLKTLYGNYEEKEGVKLFLNRPPAPISGGGSNDKLIYLGDGSTVGLKDASVATTQDGFWKFETKNVSHLFQHPNGIREVKIGRDAQVVIDEVPFSLSDLEKVKGEQPFTSLRIHCGDISLHSKKHQGSLTYDGEKLEVRYLLPR